MQSFVKIWIFFQALVMSVQFYYSLLEISSSISSVHCLQHVLLFSKAAEENVEKEGRGEHSYIFLLFGLYAAWYSIWN